MKYSKYSLHIAACLVLLVNAGGAAADGGFKGGVRVAAGDVTDDGTPAPSTKGGGLHVSSADITDNAAGPTCDAGKAARQRHGQRSSSIGSATAGGGGAGKVKFGGRDLKKSSDSAPKPKAAIRMVRADYCGNGTSQAGTHAGGGGGGAGKVNF